MNSKRCIMTGTQNREPIPHNSVNIIRTRPVLPYVAISHEKKKQYKGPWYKPAQSLKQCNHIDKMQGALTQSERM